jgi:hypothetical protein
VMRINQSSDPAPKHKNLRLMRSRPAPIWSGEIPINQREVLCAELRLHKTHAVLDLRRWRLSPDGNLQPTERGLALAMRHLSAMKELIDAAQAQAVGLLEDASVEKVAT